MSCSATIYQRLVTICLRMFLRGNVQKLPSIMTSLCVSFAEAELPDVLLYLLGCHKSKLNFKGHWETLLNHMWVVFSFTSRVLRSSTNIDAQFWPNPEVDVICLADSCWWPLGK